MDELRKAAGTAVDVWDDTGTRHEDVVNAMNDLRKVLAKNANAAPDVKYGRPMVIGNFTRTKENGDSHYYAIPEGLPDGEYEIVLRCPITDPRQAALDQVSRDCQWQASLDDKRDAERYRWLRDHASNDWLDSGITDDAVDEAINDKSQWRSRNDSSN